MRPTNSCPRCHSLASRLMKLEGFALTLGVFRCRTCGREWAEGIRVGAREIRALSSIVWPLGMGRDDQNSACKQKNGRRSITSSRWSIGVVSFIQHARFVRRFPISWSA